MFFQAEDGIRDLVRSRGLGDVYKRQEGRNVGEGVRAGEDGGDLGGADLGDAAVAIRVEAVSYTHLTLPTSDLV